MLRLNQSSYNYLYLLTSGLIIALFTWQLTPVSSKTTISLIIVVIIVLNTFIGGLRFGLLATLIATLTSIYFFLLPSQYLSPSFLTSLLEILLLVLVGVLTSLIIERYKQTDLINKHKKREKEYQTALKKLEDENIKIQQEIKMRDEFLSIASHELKTPLTSMLLKIQHLLHNIRNVSLANFSVENLLKMLETAELQTQRLSKMINDLLNVSLITTGKLDLELKETNVTQLVREITDEFSENLKKDGYALKLEADGDIFTIIDKLRIEQVITNLISNAIKYGSHKPIEVKIKKNDSKVEISVKDQGIGIPLDKQEKIFALFERGVEGKDAKGLGVGLYISNQIIKAHQGKIKVASKPNSGSVFTVELPVKKTT